MNGSPLDKYLMNPEGDSSFSNSKPISPSRSQRSYRRNKAHTAIRPPHKARQITFAGNVMICYNIII